MSPPIAFNLWDEKFVTCCEIGGATRDFSLSEVFECAHNIRDISTNSPHTNAALLRLLLAILQSCVWEADTEEERTQQWHSMWRTKELPLARIREYSERPDIRPRFDLFHATLPFYQDATLEMNEASSLSRLAMEEQLPSAIFLHEQNPQWQNPTPSLAGRLLISAQSFVLGFGKAGIGKLNGETTDFHYTYDGILLRGLTLWVVGDNLLETLLLNLVPEDKKSGDKPIWEQENPSDLRDKKGNEKELQRTASLGILDRLTWQSRLIRLLPEVDENGVISVPRIYITQGRSIKNASDYDPMKSYRETKDGVLPLAMSEHKAIWRDAHALFPQEKEEKARGADALHFLSEELEDEGREYNLHVVGMAAEPGKAANFRLWRQDRMPLPVALLKDEERVHNVQKANADAQEIADSLGQRTRDLCRYYLSGVGHKANPDDVTKLASDIDPRVSYWSRLESHFHQFLHDGATAEARAHWTKILNREARVAYESASHALGYSPRAIDARSRLSKLFYTKQQHTDYQQLKLMQRGAEA